MDAPTTRMIDELGRPIRPHGRTAELRDELREIDACLAVARAYFKEPGIDLALARRLHGRILRERRRAVAGLRAGRRPALRRFRLLGADGCSTA
jgi:hypothetical protein